MVMRKGRVTATALFLGVACGGSRAHEAKSVNTVPPPATTTSAVANVSADVSRPPAPLPPPQAGPVAFRCDESTTPPAAQRAEVTDPAAPSAPKATPPSGSKARAVPWRRLTPPTAIGAPDVDRLAFSGSTLVATGNGIRVSVDGGATFTDASENVERTSYGATGYMYGLVPVGGELMAVSEHAAYRSTEGGKRWYRCGDPPPPPDPKRIITERRRLAHGGGVTTMSVGSRIFTSVDGGRTFSEVGGDPVSRLAAKLPGRSTPIILDGLVSTGSALFTFSTGQYASLHRSTDHGATWKYLGKELAFQEDEGLVTVAYVNGKLYVSTTLGALLESTDDGDTWRRRWLSKARDPQAPRPYRLWASDGALLLDDGQGLLRLEKDGRPVRVFSRRALAVAVRGREVVALSVDYLSRSADGGRTFQDARVAGLGNDAVSKVSAAGKNIGIIASGPTAFVSTDGGATFARGPEVAGGAEIAAVAEGFYLSTKRGEGAVVLFQPATGGPPREVGTGKDVGTAPPRILGAEGKTLALYLWSGGKYLLSRDAGATFVEVAGPKSGYFSSHDGGLVRGDVLFTTSGGYLQRSVAGGPLEVMHQAFKSKFLPHLQRLFSDGGTTYAVGGSEIYVFDPKLERATAIKTKLRLDPEQKEYIALGAVRGRALLLDVRSNKSGKLYLSRDGGASLEEIERPGIWGFEALVPSADGILAATKGLWLLPAQGR